METKVYETKLKRMEERYINEPLTKAEVESLPKGFTATSVKSYLPGLFPIKNKFIPINKNERYHKKRKTA